MTKAAQCRITAVLLLLAATPAHADLCAQTIARVQSQVDAAIEKRAISESWKPKSLDALRGYQPTRRSLANAESGDGDRFEYVLDALDRARAADRAADSATCHQELANAQAALR